MTYVITIIDGRLGLMQAGREVPFPEEFGADDVVMCSSSIDFPEEYTSDPAVIEECRKLRMQLHGDM